MYIQYFLIFYTEVYLPNKIVFEFWAIPPKLKLSLVTLEIKTKTHHSHMDCPPLVKKVPYLAVIVTHGWSCLFLGPRKNNCYSFDTLRSGALFCSGFVSVMTLPVVFRIWRWSEKLFGEVSECFRGDTCGKIIARNLCVWSYAGFWCFGMFPNR